MCLYIVGKREEIMFTHFKIVRINLLTFPYLTLLISIKHIILCWILIYKQYQSKTLVSSPKVLFPIFYKKSFFSFNTNIEF